MANLTITKHAERSFGLAGDLNRHTLAGKAHMGELVKVSENTSVTLNMAEVEHCDSAGLAWLINLLKFFSQRRVSYDLQHVPDTLLKLAKISDLDHLLAAS